MLERTSFILGLFLVFHKLCNGGVSSVFLVPENSTVSLFCDSLFKAERNSAVWIKDGIVLGEVTQSANLVIPSSIDPDQQKLEKMPEIGYLIISRVRKEDEGIYWCETVRSTMKKRRFNLRIAFISPSSNLQPELHLIPETSAVTLSCKPPAAFPSPSLYWIKQETGEKIAYFGRVRTLPNGSLFVKDFRHSDSGGYACYARNIAGVQEVQKHFLFPLSPYHGATKKSLTSSIETDEISCRSRYVLSYFLWYIAGLLTTAVAVMGYGLFVVCFLKPHSRAAIQPSCVPRPLQRWTQHRIQVHDFPV